MIRFVQKKHSERTLFGIPNPPKTDFLGLFPSLICVQKSLSVYLHASVDGVRRRSFGQQMNA